MGTHPIFESDFDCLTDHLNDIENRRHREIVHFRQKWTPNSLDQLKSTLF